MISKLIYHLLLSPISHLPFKFLYLLSDGLFIIIFHLVGYRRKVVYSNIKRSFPEKSKEEVGEIERKFYKHLCDLVVESIKAFSITNEEASERMKHRNPNLINDFYEKNKSLTLVGGHYGNWELFAVSIAQVIKHQPVALYTPLKNKYFNDKVLSSRSKFGLKMLSIQDIKSKMKNIGSKPSLIIFGADQSPRKSQKAYWMTFLNQETAVQFGTEKFSKEYDLPVIFGNIYKVERGYYEVEYSLLTKESKNTEFGEITQLHTKKLEEIIRLEPAYWLWSHKRWKHNRPEGEKLYS